MGAAVIPYKFGQGLQVPIKPQGMKQFIIRCKLRDHVTYPPEYSIVGFATDGKILTNHYESVLRKYYEE